MGNDGDHIVTLADVGDLVHDLEEGLDHPLALGDVGVVAGELVGVVGGLHALGFAEEDFPHDVGTLQNDFAGSGSDKLKAGVVGQVVAGSDFVGGDDVAGFGVEDENVVHHGGQFLSF